MKFDISKKQSIGVKRTLKSLENTLLTLLTKKSFDEIQVQEICNESMIPRATFYNYFYDKYDLLNWFLDNLMKKIYPQIDDTLDHSKTLKTAISDFLDIIDSHKETFDKIINKNPKNSYFYHELSKYINNASMRIMQSCTKSDKYTLPLELVAKWNAQAFIIVFEWSYVEGNQCSRGEILQYIDTIIHGELY